MKRLFSLILACFLLGSINAQIIRCGDNIVKDQLEQKYPGVKDLINETFKNAAAQNSAERGGIYRIPVVVHVVYNTAAQQLSEPLVQEQIDILNEDFRRLNANASDTRDVFLDIAGDAMIEFYLAEEDPNGNETNGITYTETDIVSFVELDLFAILDAVTECGIDLTNIENLDPEQAACLEAALGSSADFDLDAVKSSLTGGQDAWDVSRYMNIWSCNMGVDFGGMEAPFILGFAYPPVEAPNWPAGTVPPNVEEIDGVVIHYQAWGRTNPAVGPLAGLADQGKTAVHEVGHYLGLRHIWGDGDCTMDDGISDTPAMGSNSQPQADPPPCSELYLKDTCFDDSLPDMIENYMDYSVEACQNMFTDGQINIMRSMLEGPRNGLLSGVSNTIEIDNSWFNIAPNPVSEQLEIKSSEEISLIKVLDLNGKELLVQKNNVKSLDVASLLPGVYFMSIENSNKKGIKRFIKL